MPLNEHTLVFHPADRCDVFHYADGDDDDDGDGGGGVYANLTVIVTNRVDAFYVSRHRHHPETVNDVASSVNNK